MNIKKDEGEMLKYGGEVPNDIMSKLRKEAKEDVRSVNSLIQIILKESFDDPKYSELLSF